MSWLDRIIDEGINLYNTAVSELERHKQPSESPNRQAATTPARRVGIPPQTASSGGSTGFGNSSAPQSSPQPLNTAATAILNASGAGIAQIGPTLVKQHWQLNAASVNVAPVPPNTSPVKQATCTLFVGPAPVTAYQYANTLTGSTGDTCGFAGLDIQPGQYVIAVWAGGDAGATATLTINGTYTIGPPS